MTSEAERLSFAEARQAITEYLEGADAPNSVLLMAREIFKLAEQHEALEKELRELRTEHADLGCTDCQLWLGNYREAVAEPEDVA